MPLPEVRDQARLLRPPSHQLLRHGAGALEELMVDATAAAPEAAGPLEAVAAALDALRRRGVRDPTAG